MPNVWAPSLDVRADAYSENEQHDIFKPPTADVRLRVPWEDRYAALEYMLGNRIQWPYNGTVPLYAVNGGIVPRSGTRTRAVDPLLEGVNSYDWATINLHFDPFNAFTEKITPHAEMIKVPRIGQPQVFNVGSEVEPVEKQLTPVVCWDTSSEADGPLTLFSMVEEDESPTKLVIGHDYSVQFQQLDELPPEMLTLIDHVNQATVTGIDLELTFDPETLMLSAAEASHSVGIDGAVTNTLDLHFSWRQHGWNKFWRKDIQDWDYMYLIWSEKTRDEIDEESILGPFEDEDNDLAGPSPEIYRNFPLGDFSNLLPS